MVDGRSPIKQNSNEHVFLVFLFLCLEAEGSREQAAVSLNHKSARIALRLGLVAAGCLSQLRYEGCSRLIQVVKSRISEYPIYLRMNEKRSRDHR